MTDFLEVKRREIIARMEGLQSAVDEYNLLKGAAAALAKLDGPASAPAGTAVKAARRKPGRPPGRPKGRGGRTNLGVAREAQALALVREHPGITTAELKVKMGLRAAHYLYSLMPRLAKEGKVEKLRVGWRAKAA